MTAVMRAATDLYDEFMASGDPRVVNWLFMEGPAPTLCLVGMYVLFVKVIGPAWMMDKKPFELRYTMFLYNMVLVLTNLHLVLQTVSVISKDRRDMICRVEDKSDPGSIRLAELGWWFYFIKFIEFADTIFFVLRKKFQHISTLHVVHHAIVPIGTWGGLRVEPGSYNYFFPLLNTFVHTIMYLYYGLSALGPGVQKYLWWKKYLTTIQMVQFVMVLFYVVFLYMFNCKVSKFIVYLNIFLAALFFIMFLNYFKNAYVKTKSQSVRSRKNVSYKFQNGIGEQKTKMANNVSEVLLEKKRG